jgi:hypothetical protein
LILLVSLRATTFELEELAIVIGSSIFSLFEILLEDGRLKIRWLNEDGLFPRRCIIEGVTVDTNDDWDFVDGNSISCALVITCPLFIVLKCDFTKSFGFGGSCFICTFNGIATG